MFEGGWIMDWWRWDCVWFGAGVVFEGRDIWVSDGGWILVRGWAVDVLGRMSKAVGFRSGICSETFSWQRTPPVHFGYGNGVGLQRPSSNSLHHVIVLGPFLVQEGDESKRQSACISRSSAKSTALDLERKIYGSYLQ